MLCEYILHEKPVPNMSSENCICDPVSVKQCKLYTDAHTKMLSLSGKIMGIFFFFLIKCTF